MFLDKDKLETFLSDYQECYECNSPLLQKQQTFKYQKLCIKCGLSLNLHSSPWNELYTKLVLQTNNFNYIYCVPPEEYLMIIFEGEKVERFSTIYKLSQLNEAYLALKKLKDLKTFL